MQYLNIGIFGGKLGESRYKSQNKVTVALNVGIIDAHGRWYEKED